VPGKLSEVNQELLPPLI